MKIKISKKEWEKMTKNAIAEKQPLDQEPPIPASLPTKKYDFPLGQIVITKGAQQALSKNYQDVLGFIRRHNAGNWGDIPAEDRIANEEALETGGRILSSYKLDDGTKIWIITESDRSATTILLPDEY